MPKVIVGSRNPVKINATESALRRVFPEKSFSVFGESVESGVPDQPIGRRQGFEGAENRIRELAKAFPDYQYLVGIEGTIEIYEERVMAFACVVITNGSISAYAQTGSYQLPKEVTQLIDDGIELGSAMDTIFNVSGSKYESGAIGLISDGLIDRHELYEHGISLGLVQFLELTKPA